MINDAIIMILKVIRVITRSSDHNGHHSVLDTISLYNCEVSMTAKAVDACTEKQNFEFTGQVLSGVLLNLLLTGSELLLNTSNMINQKCHLLT